VDAKSCAIRTSCPYARTFEPRAAVAVPSELADWPRPFVFRARHLDRRTVNAGEPFWFDLHVFSHDRDILEYFVRTFASLASEGLGPGRGKAELRRVESGDQLLYSADQPAATIIRPLELCLMPGAVPVTRLRVEFLTPTELKHEHKIAPRPEFPILFGRIRDRISTLSRLYGGGVMEIDYHGTGARAVAVAMTSCQTHHEDAGRRSSRTGQAHSIGGFVGTAEYEGDLAEFLPWLTAAQWVGVGRHSVWGKGEVRVSQVWPW